jgi:hypothetical protein
MRRFLPVAAASVVLAVSGCTGAAAPPGPPVPDPPLRAAPFRLASFSSCGDLLRQLRQAARGSVGPYGFGGGPLYAVPAAGRAADSATVPGATVPGATVPGATVPGAAAPQPAAPEHSTTNVHEAGVDEPDLVKTDGRRIVTVAGGVLRVVDAATRRVTGTLRLDQDGGSGGQDSLLLAGDRALVLRTGYGALGGGVAEDRVGGPLLPADGSQLSLVDIAAAAPRLLGTLSVQGRYLDARMVGSTARVVLSSTPRIAFGDIPAGTDAQRLAGNRRAIDRAGIDAWLPHYTLRRDGRRSTGRVDCSAVSTPASYSGAAMLTVLTLDLSGILGDGDPVSIAADGDTVYATPDTLYVANDPRWRFWRAPVAGDTSTELYQFDIFGPGRPRFAASGAVPGWLLNQYSMSDYDGRLRVATTTAPPFPQPAAGAPSASGALPPGPAPAARTDSAVSVLTRHGDRLVLTGVVRGLGAGEQIYAVRFVGPVGYVVTFRQTDPLYAVDLRDPAHPRLTGTLELTGFSAYLHPLPGDRLLGVGQEAGRTGAVQGLQVSLFDVSDPAHPVRVARQVIGGAHSEAEYDPHAFLYWPPTGTLVLPVQSYPGPGGALVLRVHDGGLSEVGTVPPADPGQWFGPARSLVVGGTLWTLTPAGLQANDLGTLIRQAWLPFR